MTHWGSGSGSNLLDYFQAVANSRVVGLEVAFLINALVIYYNTYNSIYIILSIEEDMYLVALTLLLLFKN